MALRARLILAGTATATVVVDQISKAIAIRVLNPGERVDIIGSFFGFVLARNPGAAFSMLPGRSVLLAWLTTLIVVVVTVWAARSREFPILFGMIIGGGLGNLADRIFRSPGFLRGRVVDFVDFSFWPTFNLADAAITVGVLLLLLGGLASRKR